MIREQAAARPGHEHPADRLLAGDLELGPQRRFISPVQSPHRPRQVKRLARLILQSPTVCLRHPSDRSDEVLSAELRGLQVATRGGGAMAKRSRGGLGQHGAAPDRGERTERR